MKEEIASQLIPEESKPTRRRFLKIAGQATVATLCLAPIVASCFCGYTLVGNPLNRRNFYSFSDARETLPKRRGPDIFQICKIHGRVKSIDPQNPSLDDTVNLVLTDGETDLNVKIWMNGIYYAYFAETTPLFGHRCEKDRKASNESWARSVMIAMKYTQPEDQVSIEITPLHYSDNLDRGIVYFKNYSLLQRIEEDFYLTKR